ncbi:DUF4129 domain-containing protein [Candidatus Venteria ishoeyi]|uniref:Protein-glutamine gamma-glutamyltransferase-like C-terminal domain-containing protein n=1 Tax=Candidatus Venteria ishoeyi TaxID=1899563 RepID=A0A1H6F915_9GAMM|nr:DUF4129 domain-containing protein [Candidatus Venteria ishoeyi]MDM8548020.1 DUF4129 domain-containing protein [Candidatus Venteria ishoeyi]SEH06612.1 Uncharacterised protein [Candidatus Venteria ishoeyi]
MNGFDAQATTTVTDHDIQTEINRILQDADFDTWHQDSWTQWSAQDTPSEETLDMLSGFNSWVLTFSQLMEMALWLVFLVALVVLGWFLYRSFIQNQAIKFINSDKRHVSDAELSDLIAVPKQADLHDPPTQAWRLWQQGQHREALGLLYRVSLSGLRAQGLEIKDNMTEGECLRLLAELPSVSTRDYISHLFRAWLFLAYGHQLPDSDKMQDFCQHWSRHFKLAET